MMDIRYVYGVYIGSIHWGIVWSYSVVVIIRDFESCDLGSNPSRTFLNRVSSVGRAPAFYLMVGSKLVVQGSSP